MITFKTNRLVGKFLSDVGYQAQTPSKRAELAQAGFVRG